VAELALGLARPRRTNVVLAAYRWRYEIGAAIVLPVALVESDREIGWVWLLVVLAGVAGMVWRWAAARRWTLARLWVVVVRHRLRPGFAGARVCPLDGRLPAIRWAAPMTNGVRVLVSCPAGVGVDRINARRDVLAAAASPGPSMSGGIRVTPIWWC